MAAVASKVYFEMHLSNRLDMAGDDVFVNKAEAYRSFVSSIDVYSSSGDMLFTTDPTKQAKNHLDIVQTQKLYQARKDMTGFDLPVEVAQGMQFKATRKQYNWNANDFYPDNSFNIPYVNRPVFHANEKYRIMIKNDGDWSGIDLKICFMRSATLGDEEKGQEVAAVVSAQEGSH